MSAVAGRRRIAIVLFNLGGPDRLESVRPFLFNLFNDPAIIRVPNPFRWLIAKLISSRRAPVARAIYERLGGKSPLLENTFAQARALEAVLWDEGDVKCFVAMRYWHPLTEAAVTDVQNWRPDEVVLLPLYPQFSTTTTASSAKAWAAAAHAAGLSVPTRTICCYPTETGFIQANVAAIQRALDQIREHPNGKDLNGRDPNGQDRNGQELGQPRILFSAHGLPEKIVADGDPYQWQCEQTAAALATGLGLAATDWVSCYQSRVGPMKWIGPSTEEEIERAGRDRVPLIVVPIAFVSEHSETLVEIGEEYRHLAGEKGVPSFDVVPTVGTTVEFIRGLAELVRQSRRRPERLCSQSGGRLCPAGLKGCPQSDGAS